MKKPNEESACQAFSLILAQITGRPYRLREAPDETNRATKDIDYIFAAPGSRREVAAEHTIVESFEGQLAYVNKAFDIVAEINALCKNSLPKDHFYFLAIPDALIHSLDRPGRARFVSEMAPLVAGKSRRLRNEKHVTLRYHEHEIWFLHRGSHPEMNGNVYHVQRTPDQAGLLVRLRLARALNQKLPKLLRYRLTGFTTALLLEDISGALSGLGGNASSVGMLHRVAMWLLVDYLVVFASNNQHMVVGNVWKEHWRWHRNVPYSRRYHFTYDKDGKMNVGT